MKLSPVKILLVVTGVVLIFKIFASEHLLGMVNQDEPAPVDIRPTRATYISSGRSLESFEDNFDLWLGHRRSGDYDDQYIYLRFQMPSDISDTTIISDANLTLSMAAHSPNDSDLNVIVERIIGVWPEEELTWQNAENLAVDESIIADEDLNLTFGEKVWDVTEIVKAWLETVDDSSNLELRVKATGNLTDRYRGFWSENCSTDSCGDGAPKLTLIYENQSVTPTTSTPISTSILPPPTPTPSPTPTPTPSPTQGIKSITLRAQPEGVIEPGGEVTYIIDIVNGPYELFSVNVSNTIPSDLNLLEDSIFAQTDWNVQVDENLGAVKWIMTTPMPISDTVTLSYRAVRHTAVPEPTAVVVTKPPTVIPTTNEPSSEPTGETTREPTNAPTTAPTANLTAVPTGEPTVAPTDAPTPVPADAPIVTPTDEPTSGARLSITKSGNPSSVRQGDEIAYNLTIINLSQERLEDLEVYDYIPAATQIENYGGGSVTEPPTRIIHWPPFNLGPGIAVSRSFTVRVIAPSAAISNDVYFVEDIDIVDGQKVVAERAVGQEPVITKIISSTQFLASGQSLLVAGDEPPCEGTACRPQPTTLDVANWGAVIQWQHPSTTTFPHTGKMWEQRSNPTFNPPRIYFPIQLYPNSE